MASKNKQLLSVERTSNLYLLLERINMDPEYLEFIQKNESKCLPILNECLTHTSANQKTNHERLEFLGDAVLRLASSEYIESKFPNLKVGERSALRAQLVSDEWLSSVGEGIKIKEIMLIGVKAAKDKAASSTLQAEATEALIGAIYECFQDLKPIKDWLQPIWNQESKKILADPHMQNTKSALQEWSQGNGFEKPKYILKEISKQHGDPKRFLCEVVIEGEVMGIGRGSSRKKAEKEAAQLALKKLK